MLKLRKFLCRSFGVIALLSLLVSFGTVPSVFRVSHQRHSLPVAGATIVSWKLRSIILIVISKLVLAMPLGLAIVYGIAWWTTRNRKPSARGWIIAASITMLASCIPQLVTMFYLMYYSRLSDGALRFLIDWSILNGIMLALGISGLVAFARHDVMAQNPLAPARPPRMVGDGTSGFLDGLSVVLGGAGVIAGMRWWAHWGRAQHLPFAYGFLSWPLIVVVVLLTTTIHEIGHTTMGLALGMKLRAFIVGPFHWSIRDGRWKFKFLLAKLLPLGGATGLVPTDPNQSRWSDIGMIAAGPMASLLTGLISMELALTAKSRPYERGWELLAVIATIALVQFVVNLIPLRPESLYSDGARIYQMLKGGPWADLHRAFSIVTASSVTPLRPRDYDIAAIQRAGRSFTQGHQALLLRLFASSYYLDTGKLAQAGEALAEAEAVYRESPFEIPAELCMAIVFRIAFLRRDPACARLWWERMEAQKPAHFGADYWLAKSALLWSENRLEEARKACKIGSALAQELPVAGGYEFDRYRCSLLFRALDESAAVG
jgi:hypothetical protein